MGNGQTEQVKMKNKKAFMKFIHDQYIKNKNRKPKMKNDKKRSKKNGNGK